MTRLIIPGREPREPQNQLIWEGCGCHAKACSCDDCLDGTIKRESCWWHRFKNKWKIF